MKAFLISSCLLLTGCVTTNQVISEQQLNRPAAATSSEYELHYLNPNTLSFLFNEDLTTAYYRSSENTFMTIDTIWLSPSDVAMIINGAPLQTIFYFHLAPNIIYYVTSESYNGTMYPLSALQKFELQHKFYSTTLEPIDFDQSYWHFRTDDMNITVFNDFISFHMTQKFGITALTIHDSRYEYVEQVFK